MLPLFDGIFWVAEMGKKAVSYPRASCLGVTYFPSILRSKLFNIVVAVDLYHGFVPWCQRSEVLKEYSEGSFDAELQIGFKFLVKSYISHVEFERPKWIKVASIFLKEVATRLMGAFSDRCRLVYGPGVPSG